MSVASSRVSPPLSAREGAEHRFLLHDVPWWTYVALRDALDHGGLRMTYLAGELELMSPSDLHEESKSIIGRLLEVWAEEMDVDLRAFGSMTFRHETRDRGLEPDECYTLGPRTKTALPHIAIEVVVESPLVDKLAVYAGLGVPEVWLWTDAVRCIQVNQLVGGKYESRERSALLPDIDLTLLSRFVRPGESHTSLAKGYRAALVRQ